MDAAAPREKPLFYEHGAILAVSSLVSLFYLTKVWCFDVWWHLATGRWIFQHGEIPRHDPFSFSMQGEPWLVVNWLAESLMYGIYAIGGITGLVLMKVLFSFLRLSIMGYALRFIRVPMAIIVPLLIGCGVLTQMRYSMARPMIVGAFLLCLGIAICLWWWKKHDSSIWLLLPLLVLWLPIHGGAILVFPLLGLALFECFATRQKRRTWVHVSLVLLACFLALVLMRDGRDLISILVILHGFSLAEEVTIEWGTTISEGSVVWMPIALIALSILANLLHWRRRWIPLGLALLGAALAFRSSRTIYEGLLLCLPALALGLRDFSDLLIARNLDFTRRLLPLMLILFIPGLHLAAEQNTAINVKFGTDIAESHYPVETLETLKRLPFGYTFNDFTYGGYLIWHDIPGGVFHDGRNTSLYTEEFLQGVFLPAIRSEEGLTRIADRYNISYGLVSSDRQAGTVITTSSQWLPIHYGKTTALYVRRSRADSVTDSGFRVMKALRWNANPRWMNDWYAGLMSSEQGRRELTEEIVYSLSMTSTSRDVGRVLLFLDDEYPEYYQSLLQAIHAAYPEFGADSLLNTSPTR